MIVAIVPAAGLSVRMGRPKLILELGGSAVIVKVVRALLDGGADRVLVVTAPSDQDGAERIAELVEQAGANSLPLPFPTPDMRATIEHAIRWIVSEEEGRPEGVLIAPGDAVAMTPRVVSAVVERFKLDKLRIVVPRREGTGAHPLALPWTVAALIPDLPTGSGVNALVGDHRELVVEMEVNETGPDLDLDTPEDYARLIAQP